jgi:Icc-related predicted phosphoesterase
MRVFAVSDLHTDFKENWEYLRKISSRQQYRDDLLIVAGDIADNLEIIEKTLSHLKRHFKYVSYIPGNHELWVRGKEKKSIDKLKEILDLCEEIGVQTNPAHYNGVWIVPLFSWYETKHLESFIKDDEYLPMWADFHLCRWDESIDCLGRHFAEMNKSKIENIEGEVISFSHFLPLKKLLPDLSRIKFKGLGKVSVCPGLSDQIKKINSKIHIFGHTHLNCDVVIDDVRYIQNALRYPRERKDGYFDFKLIMSV